MNIQAMSEFVFDNLYSILRKMPQRGAIGSKLFLFRLSYAVLNEMRPLAKWNSIGMTFNF